MAEGCPVFAVTAGAVSCLYLRSESLPHAGDQRVLGNRRGRCLAVRLPARGISAHPVILSCCPLPLFLLPVPSSCRKVTANLLAEQAQKGGLIAPLRLRTHDQTAPNTCTGLMRSLTVSSKLSSGKWPNPDGVARKVVETLNGWGALQQPQQNSGSGSRDTCSGETNGNGRDEGSAGAEDCPTVTAHAAPVVATGKRCPVDGVLNGLRGNEFSSTKASIASPSQSAKLGRGSGETLFDSTLTDPYPGGGQPVGAGMSHDGLVGGVVVDRGAATPSASSAYVARSQGDEARNVAVELATVTEGEVAVTPGTAPFLFSLSVESAFAEVSRAAHAVVSVDAFRMRLNLNILAESRDGNYQ